MADQSNLIDQLKQLVGNDFSTQHLQQILAQIQGLGIKVQNQQRGDPRPRFLMPTGETWDFGPGGWINRGNIGDWDSQYNNPNAPGGNNVGSQQGGTLGDLSNTPGYQFALQQGIQGIERNQFAQGTGLTGGTLKRIQMFGTGLADQISQNQFQDWLNTTKLGMPPPPA
jgi:hypothetical protein